MKITYYANYNGCEVEDYDTNIENVIIDLMYDHCDDTGKCLLDEESIQRVIKDIVQKVHGDVSVDVIVDTITS